MKSILRQDVGWYDTSNPEELATKFAEAMVKVQKGLSSQSMQVFEGLGYGTGGLAMGFYFQPEVAAITLATVPLLILPASVILSSSNLLFASTCSSSIVFSVFSAPL